MMLSDSIFHKKKHLYMRKAKCVTCAEKLGISAKKKIRGN